MIGKSLILYIYHKCSTCKVAVAFLKKSGRIFVTKEITQESPSIEELRAMLGFQGNQLKKLFNTSGDLYREMNLSASFHELTEEAAFELLRKHGMLVKRPFLIGKDFGVVGFKEEVWEKSLCKQ